MFRYKIDDSVMLYLDSRFYFGRVTDILPSSSSYPYEITLSGGSREWCKEEELVELIERP